MKQLDFNTMNCGPKADSQVSKCRRVYGGAIFRGGASRAAPSRGRRKSRRPLDCKKPLHLVLRADLARPVFLNHTPFIEKIINKFPKKFDVKVYEKSVNANHLHLVLKFTHRFHYQRFVRAVSGVLAQRLKFSWLNLPYTRVVAWGRDFKKVCLYVIQNQREAWGLIRYVPRRRRTHHKWTKDEVDQGRSGPTIS